MSRILISHVDLDGHGIITLAKYFQDVKGVFLFDRIMGQDYGFEDDADIFGYISEYDEIVIADLSLKKEKVDWWVSQGKSVMFFDHHGETQWIEEFEGSVWDDSRCGTKIFWEEYLKPKIGRYKPIVEDFVQLVDTYDMWRETHPLWEEARSLNNVLYGIVDYSAEGLFEKYGPFYKIMTKKFDKMNSWRWTSKEKEIIERALAREQEMYERAMEHISYRQDSRDRYFGVVMIPSKISVVAARILTEQDYLDYLVVLNSYRGLNGKLSFRSRRGFNCPDISMANGHAAAAGGIITVEQAQQFWENEDLSFRYNEDYDENKPKEIFDGIT